MCSELVSLRARDGVELAATLHPPQGGRDPLRAVLLASATAVPRSFYEPFARYLAGEGLATLTLDYRGIGGSRSGPVPGRSRMHEWGELDLAAALAWLRERFPEHRLLAIGHSAGGQLLGLAENNHLLDGLLGVAAQSGYWGFWPRPRRYAMALLWYAIIPGLTRALGYFPARRLRLGEDLPAGVALEWAAWCRDPEYLAGRLRRPSIRHLLGMRGPILAYSFADDPLGPRAAVDWMTERYARAARERRHISPEEVGGPVGHFGFFRRQFRNSLWQEAAQWLKQT